jgi:nucleotide-binding universal stress UspA family protein
VTMPSTRGVQRILCATDLSARSTAALRRAGSLARQTGARLTLLHVIDARQPERVARMRANRAYVELLSQADRAFGSAAGFIDVVVRRGNVLEIIAASVREWDADLIVVAAPKSRRLESIVGTTAERLVRTAKRPVLVVRREVQGGYRDVAIATDLSSASVPMIRTAVRLGALERASVAVVHAVQPSYDGMMQTVGLDESTIGLYKRNSQEHARQRLQTMIADAGLPFESTRTIVRSEPPAAAIRAVLEYERPELLAIGASRWFLLKRLLVGSVADRLLRTALCDVLVVPHRPAVLRLGAPAAGAHDRLRAVPLRRDIIAAPRFVSVQRRLKQHDASDRRAHANE